MTDAEAVEFLRQLVSIPSPCGGEAEAVSYLVDVMQRYALRAWVDEVGNAVGVQRSTFNVQRESELGHGGVLRHIADARGTGTEALQPEVVFLGHIDTVAGYVPVRIEHGGLYGRGAVDAKGPLAAAVVAAVRAQTAGRSVMVVGAVQEEGPSLGAQFVCDHYRGEAEPPALIIGEPSGADAVVLGYKGSMRADLYFEQAVGHSAGPDASICDVAVAAWQRLCAVCEHASEREQSRDGPPPVFDRLSPTLLAFESRTDGLRAWARLQANFRLPVRVPPDSAQDLIRTAVPEARVEFGQAQRAYRARKDTPLVASFLRALRAEGVRPRFKVKTGTSDMNVVAPAWGCQTLAYGPGDSSLDHTPDEHIVVDEYLRAIRVLTRVFSEGFRFQVSGFTHVV